MFSALSRAVLDPWSCSQHDQKWTKKEGLSQCDVPKTMAKGLFALVYMQCIPPMATVAVCKCMIKAIEMVLKICFYLAQNVQDGLIYN